MDTTLRTALWRQFGAAIDMLDNAIAACPDALWSDRAQRPELWSVAFHAIFWLDLYLGDSVEGFAPPPPFTRDELDPAGLPPERPYTKDELRTYLVQCRDKCRAMIGSLTDETAREHRRFPSVQGSVMEIVLYNMRHVQHHAGQLNLLLRKATDSAPGWVSSAAGELDGEPA